MLNVIKTSEELTKKELYKLTVAPKTALSEKEGENLTVAKWAIYQRENSEGETIETLAIIDDEGKVFATSSQACINSFNEMNDMLEGDFSVITVLRRTSKQNRDYFVVTLVD